MLSFSIDDSIDVTNDEDTDQPQNNNTIPSLMNHPFYGQGPVSIAANNIK